MCTYQNDNDNTICQVCQHILVVTTKDENQSQIANGIEEKQSVVTG